MAEDRTHNGWKNYETWACALWLDNDQDSYNEARRVSRQPLHDWQAAEDLKAWVEDMMPDLGASMWSDLLRGAFEKIDWHEVVEHYREDED